MFPSTNSRQSYFGYTNFFTVYQWTKQILIFCRLTRLTGCRLLGRHSSTSRTLSKRFINKNNCSHVFVRIVAQTETFHKSKGLLQYEIVFPCFAKQDILKVMSSTPTAISSCHTAFSQPQITLIESSSLYPQSQGTLLQFPPSPDRTPEESRQLLLNILDEALSLLDDLSMDF